VIRLLIADDEYLVIESIKYIIEKFIDDVEIVGSAKSGREAIEKAIELKPDVIFMDIRMPGIDGIDAIKQIKETNNDTKFVIITAFEYFEYAKEAVNLGVFEYILKPIKKEKVIETLNNLSKTISLKRKAIQREIILKEKINKITPHLEGQFIFTLLFNGGLSEDIPFYEDIFNLKLDYGYILIGSVHETKTSIKEDSFKISLEKQKFYNIFSNELKNITNCLIGPPMLDRIVAFIPCSQKEDTYKIRNNSINCASKLADRINERISLKYKLGIGRSYKIDNFSKSYNEACMAISAWTNEIVNHFEDIIPSSDKVDLYPTIKEKALINRITVGDINGSLELFEEIFWSLVSNYNEDIDKIKSILIELLIILQRELPFEFEEKKFSEQSFLMYMLKTKDIGELLISFTNHIKIIIENILESREKKYNYMISEALEFINNNYHNNISLDDVAKEINMSYHYFSKFFKESIGKNFIDYLTELRIEKSKEILKSRDVSIKEVCYEIGYSDPNYFSKLFKKITGMTPSEYKAFQEVES